MRKIALVNQKGGVGKTTTAVNLSAALASLGKRTLLVDLDPQANATVSLGLVPHKLNKTVYTLIAGRSAFSGTVQPVAENLHLLPSNIELAGAELELSSAIGREYTLRDSLVDVKEYDYVLIDSPPSMGILNVNGLTYASEVFVPIQCEFLALHGVSLLLRTIQMVRKRLNPTLELSGVIACMYDARKGLSQEVLEEIRKHFGDKLFRTRIRTNVKLAEAPSHGATVFAYAPGSNGAADYLNLAREVTGLPEPETDATVRTQPETTPQPSDVPPPPAPTQTPEAIPNTISV